MQVNGDNPRKIKLYKKENSKKDKEEQKNENKLRQKCKGTRRNKNRKEKGRGGYKGEGNEGVGDVKFYRVSE